MNENKIVKLQVINNVEIEEKVEAKVQPSMMSNPIYRNMLSFHNSKIGEKLSVKDILR